MKKYTNRNKWHKTFNGNAGHVLEDVVNDRLCYDKHNTKKERYFFAVGENLVYHMNNKRYEMDNLALRIGKNGKKYALVFEDKLSNHKSCMAHKQLRRHKYYLEHYTYVDRVFLFYAHNYKLETKGYELEWYRPAIKHELALYDDTPLYKKLLYKKPCKICKTDTYFKFDEVNYWQEGKKLHALFDQYTCLDCHGAIADGMTDYYYNLIGDLKENEDKKTKSLKIYT